MRKILIVLAFFQTLILVAQDKPEVPKYKAKNHAGIFYYQQDEVLKKTKIKKDKEVAKAIKLIKTYNDNIKKISFLKSPDLNGLELYVNSLGMKRFTDQETSLEVQNKVNEIIVPIKDSIAKHEDILNRGMASFLSKKQLKRWTKYQKKEKQKNLFDGKEVKYARPPNLNQGRRNLRNRGVY